MLSMFFAKSEVPESIEEFFYFFILPVVLDRMFTELSRLLGEILSFSETSNGESFYFLGFCSLIFW
jgi:hypothetical protein